MTMRLRGDPATGRTCRPPWRATRRRLDVALVAPILLLAGCSGDADPDSSIVVSMSEYTFATDVPPVFREGETVHFVADNIGRLIHEIQVLDSDAILLGRTGRVMPGERDEVTVRFDRAGIYQLICDVDDHLSRGQRSLFQVLTPDGESILDSTDS